MQRQTAACVLSLAVVACARAQGPDGVAGAARVVDGDTLVIGPARVRMFGIDAPELHQDCRDASGAAWPCGVEARAALEAAIAGAPVRCRVVDHDVHQRLVGVCGTEANQDLSQWMVQQGWALAYRSFSPRYVADEDAARRARLHLWAGAFEPPWRWRKEHPRGGPAAPPPSPACAIKGNINAHGARLYHVPNTHGYDETRIDTSAGERWFCSEAEAQAAGWRRAATH